MRKWLQNIGIVSGIWTIIRAIWALIGHFANAQTAWEIVKDWPTYLKNTALIVSSPWFPLALAVLCLIAWWVLGQNEKKKKDGLMQPEGYRYLVHKHRFMLFFIFTAVGAIIGALIWFAVFKLPVQERTTVTKSKSPAPAALSTPEPPAEGPGDQETELREMYAHESSDMLRSTAQRFARLMRTNIAEYLHRNQLNEYVRGLWPKALSLRDELKNRIGAAIVEPPIPTLLINPEQPANPDNIMELAGYFDVLARQVPPDLNPQRAAVDLWNVRHITQKGNTFIGADTILKAGKAETVDQQDNLMIAPPTRNKDETSTPPSPTPNK